MNVVNIKPKLLDSILGKKIIKTFKPEDYWAPTKNTFKSFIQNYVRPNIIIVIIIIIFIIFLVYRYRVIKRGKEISEPNRELFENPSNYYNPQPQLDNYQKIWLQLYNHQKEVLHEPKVDGPRLAYPMYPYKGGSLQIPNSR